MAVKPIDLKRLEEKVENIYEAVIVLSKRAQQINEEIKIEFNQQIEMIKSKLSSIYADDPDTMETYINPDQVNIAKEFEKRPKPTQIAIDELLNDKIEYRYKDTDSE
ncbi:MAG: hypothetical protein IGBAC_1217 [Ignavibacteriae bacterium]|nr:MAG: hypothetical protein IGBAC_1217 [Ignavibacteriota bacterium]